MGGPAPPLSFERGGVSYMAYDQRRDSFDRPGYHRVGALGRNVPVFISVSGACSLAGITSAFFRH